MVGRPVPREPSAADCPAAIELRPESVALYRDNRRHPHRPRGAALPEPRRPRH